MTKLRTRYTKEALGKVASQCKSIREVLIRLGIVRPSGSQHALVTKRLREYGIDTTHFLGQNWRQGMLPANFDKIPADQILVKGRTDKRTRRRLLRRALLEIGRKEECAKCGQGIMWCDEKLVLPIDHIDGDHSNDLGENLRFMCPNCHTQTPTFGQSRGTKKRVCSECRKPVTRYSKTGLCRGCSCRKIGTRVRK